MTDRSNSPPTPSSSSPNEVVDPGGEDDEFIAATPNDELSASASSCVMLEELDCVEMVLKVFSGAEALAIMKKQPIDIVLLDTQLPHVGVTFLLGEAINLSTVGFVLYRPLGLDVYIM